MAGGAQGAVPAAYDGAAHTCSNTYCHGNFPGGNRSAAALSWAAAGKLACTSCHGAPPPLDATTHHPGNTVCATCHGTGYSGTIAVESRTETVITKRMTSGTITAVTMSPTRSLLATAIAIPIIEP